MKKLIIISGLMLILATSCRVKLAVPPQFSSNATSISVKGLNTWSSFRQKLTFGKYKTSNIRTGMAITNEINNPIVNLMNRDGDIRSTKQSLKYKYVLEDGQFKSEIFCKEYKWNLDQSIFYNKTRSTEIFIDLESEYSFAAAITFKNLDKDEAWKVLLVTEDYADPEAKRSFFTIPEIYEKGYATDGADTINIRTVRVKNMTNANGKQTKLPFKTPVGYELKVKNTIIAIIDTQANYIWMDNDLDEREKMLVASISSAIMLRKINTLDDIH
ncbi:MAG: hypothetical protein WBP45_13665 [Daejeonella sp.]